MFRALLAVVVGFVVWSILWIGLGAALQALSPTSFDAQGLTRQPGILAACLVGSVVISLASGLATSAMAPHKAWGATVALGLALLAVGVAVQASVWNAMPLWYHLSFLALLLPMAMLGGRLRPRGAGTSPTSLAAAH